MRLLNIRETAEHLNCSTSTLRKMSQRGKIPYIMMCYKYYYDLDILESCLKKQMLSSLETEQPNKDS
ncbi:MAG: helix-turn-helix domain-containing protein [Clostridiaceae bacterium]|nr:helix-turn-helix domain-containing protein [Clostridiaceae bacterium]